MPLQSAPQRRHTLALKGLHPAITCPHDTTQLKVNAHIPCVRLLPLFLLHHCCLLSDFPSASHADHAMSWLAVHAESMYEEPAAAPASCEWGIKPNKQKQTMSCLECMPAQLRLSRLRECMMPGAHRSKQGAPMHGQGQSQRCSFCSGF